MRATWVRRMLLAVLLPAIVSAWAGQGVRAQQNVQGDQDPVKQALAKRQQERQATGQSIYGAECAACHGLLGDGRGPAARRFAQHPTDFTQGVYKLRATLGSLPAQGDLERTIRTGMPGTEMVPFRHVLSEGGIRAVAAYLRTLSNKFDDAAAVAAAEEKRVKMPGQRPFPPSEDSIAKGKEIYVKRCLECHGEQGEGSTTEKDDAGFPVIMQDFRSGVFKAGHSDEDLVRTVLAGVLGTSMGSYGGELSVEEAYQVVDYVRSLAPRRSGFGRLIALVFRERPSGYAYRAD